MVTDVTEQRHYQELQRTQAALRESERRFREMIDALPVAIYTTDLQGRIAHFNPAAVDFSGRAPDWAAIIGRDLETISSRRHAAAAR